jgi:phosphoenolpyruvate carboxykinase (ATP)
MLTLSSSASGFDAELTALGLGGVAKVHRNVSLPELYEHALRRGEGTLGLDGQLIVATGTHTGRSPKDKFFVREPGSEHQIDWGNTNKAIEPATFDALFTRVTKYLSGKEIFSLDCHVGADPHYQLPVRIITELAWQNVFARDLLIDNADGAESFSPEFTVLDAALFEADPARDGTNSGTFILVNLARKLILIGGTQYAGEIKKSVFTLMNYLMPLRDVLPMHCSANVGRAKGNVAIFFGLSGTGKTTLSADPHRPLIGDDEHGWSNDGVFNFEGGCYAKVIKLRQEQEPEIWAASHRFGTIIENVVIDPVTRKLDLDSAALTENTRSAYPLTAIPNVVAGAKAGHPNTIVMLGSPGLKRCITSCPAIRRKPPAPKTASWAPSRRFRRVSARHSWSTIPPSMPSCSVNAWPNTPSRAGWSTPAGSAVRRASAAG